MSASIKVTYTARHSLFNAQAILRLSMKAMDDLLLADDSPESLVMGDVFRATGACVELLQGVIELLDEADTAKRRAA